MLVPGLYVFQIRNRQLLFSKNWNSKIALNFKTVNLNLWYLGIEWKLKNKIKNQFKLKAQIDPEEESNCTYFICQFFKPYFKIIYVSP